MDDVKNISIQEIEQAIESLKNKRREFVRKIWDIDSDLLTLREEKNRRCPKRYDDQ